MKATVDFVALTFLHVVRYAVTGHNTKLATANTGLISNLCSNWMALVQLNVTSSPLAPIATFFLNNVLPTLVELATKLDFLANVKKSRRSNAQNIMCSLL